MKYIWIYTTVADLECRDHSMIYRAEMGNCQEDGECVWMLIRSRMWHIHQTSFIKQFDVM